MGQNINISLQDATGQEVILFLMINQIDIYFTEFADNNELMNADKILVPYVC